MALPMTMCMWVLKACSEHLNLKMVSSWLERRCQKKQLRSFPNSCSSANTCLGAPTVGRPGQKINGFPAQASSRFGLFSTLYWLSHLLPPCTMLVAWLVDSVLSKAGENASQSLGKGALRNDQSLQ